MPSLPRILPGERARFALLAVLLLLNGIILESNDVVATSGFVSNVGADKILWVWAADMVIVILTSAAYSLVVDRMKRERLALRLFVAFGAAYVMLYSLFALGIPRWIPYFLITIVNDQQWILLPMLIWGLANDVFSTAEAKRVFALLGVAAFVGAVLGNALTAVVSRWLAQSGGSQGSIQLLLSNAGLLLFMVALLGLSVRWLQITAHQSCQEEKVLDTLREGVGFIKDVPAYRYLTLAMVLLGFGLNVVEYQLINSAAQAYSEASGLETFYAILRAVRIVLMLIVQGGLSTWLLARAGFKSIFVCMPAALLAGLLLAFVWPALLGVVIGEYAVRITLQGIDEPSRCAFLGLVPDERRGRVTAFMNGYLYPLGSIVSCVVVSVILILMGQRVLSADLGRAIYFGLAFVCALTALWAITRFRAHYDASMLNWRLKRRQRGQVLAGINF